MADHPAADYNERIARLSPGKREQLMRWIAAQGEPARPASLPELVPAPAERFEPFPLTTVQEVYWAGRSGLYDLAAGGTNIYQLFEVVGPFEPARRRLEAAFDRLIRRHDMLRAVVVPSGREVVQQVLAEVPPLHLEVADLRHLDEEDREAAVGELRERLCLAVGALDRWPLFDVVAQRVEEQRTLLHTRFETVLMDGEARMQLVRELFELFADPEAELPPIGCTYRDYALAWRRVAGSELARRSRDYWLARLDGLPPAPELPLARELDPGTPMALDRRFVVLEGELWRRLKARAAGSGLTPSVPLLAAYAEVVERWGRRRAFTLCTFGSYRPPIHPDLHLTVGNFNTIGLLQVDGGSATFEERARQIQSRNSADLEHSHFSGLEVLRELRRRRGASSRALFPVWFNSVVEYSHHSYLAGAQPLADPADGCALRFGDLIMHPPQSLLLATAYEREDGALVTSWQAVKAAFPTGVVEEMSSAYGRLLRRLAVDEGAWGARRLPLLPGDDGGVAAGSGPDDRQARVQVLDGDLERCPPQVTGEIWVESGEVEDGAWQGSPLRSRSPSTDPRTGEAIYPTGVLGRRLSDGGLEALGGVGEVEARVLGYRVELPRVEARLAAQPGVRCAAVIGPRAAGRGLRAFVVPEAGGGPSAAELRRRLDGELAYYLVPGEIRFLDALPRRADGSPDRAALAALEEAGQRDGGGGEPEGFTPVEAEIAELWHQVLGTRPDGPESSFLNPGLDSLSLVSLVRRLEERFGRRVPLAAVFLGGTVRDLARGLAPGEQDRRAAHPQASGDSNGC